MGNLKKEKGHPEAALSIEYACTSRPEGRSYGSCRLHA